MGVNDGYVIGLTKVLDHGPSADRWNVVVVAEGFQASEMPAFHQEVSTLVDKLFNTKPFDELWCAVNVYRLDVASDESGADEPSGGDCTGSGLTRDTYFDATFCAGGTQRALAVDSALVIQTVAANLPGFADPDVALVCVNSTTYGGLGGSVATYSLGFSPISGLGGVEIAIHELGHTPFGLADEYPYDSGDTYNGPEPLQPNITADATPTIKWNDLIAPATPVPTKTNPDCSEEDEGPSPVPVGTVGAFEGAGYHHCGLFRPEYDCEMRSLGHVFCAVCDRRIREELEPLAAPDFVTLTTPTIDFSDIPEGLGGVGVTTYRAAVFEIGSCSPVTLQVTDGPTGGFGLPLGGVVVVNPGGAVSEGRIWVSYTSTVAGAMASGTVTVQSIETNEEWVIPITANTVARPTTAVALVLDRSGSMGQDPGDGTTKVSKLREAANTFVDVMLPGDGLSLVRFNHNADILVDVDDVAVNGGMVKSTIDGPELSPSGDTSIGGALAAGTQALEDAPAGYSVKAMALLTDGMETASPYIADVAGAITANTFAIGFGTPANVDVGKLEILTGTHEGYLLVTGAITLSEGLRLQKYFLQILAGITNADIVVDPSGTIAPGQVHRIPFVVTEADYGLDAILLARDPRVIDFRLETPSGAVIDPVVAGAELSVELIRTPQVSYYRMSLPALSSAPFTSHGGLWHAVLRLGAVGGSTVGIDTSAQSSRRRNPYSFLVHSYSSLRFKAYVTRSGDTPNSYLLLTAVLSEYEMPVEERATVWAEMTRPDASTATVPLTEQGPGHFTGATREALSGLYRFRVRAQGKTLAEEPFTREQTLTMVLGRTTVPDPEPGFDLCRLLLCLQGKDGTKVEEHLLDCLRRLCRQHGT